MRIALVTTASTGGIGRHVAGLAPRLVARGHWVQVYCPPATARTHGLDRLAERGELTLYPLSRLGTARGADVVHAHGYKAIVLAVALTRPGGPPLVGSWHNAILRTGRSGLVGRMLQRLSARSADLTLGASSDLVVLARTLGARRAEFGPVAAPVGSAWLAWGPDELEPRTRAEHGAGEARVVLSIGRLAAQKNYPMLLDVAAHWRGRTGTGAVVFWVAGDGPERAALQARIDAERLPVRLLGARSEVTSLLHAADAFLLTSSWEARALVAQEALGFGVPFVGTDVGGIRELVGEAGLLVPAGDAAAAVLALERVLADPELADRLRADGLARAAGWPDEDDVAADLERAYRSVRRS